MRYNITLIGLIFASAALTIAADVKDPLLDAKLDLALLYLRYTDHHAKVIEAKARIDALSKTTPAIPPTEYISHIQARLSEAQMEDADLKLRYSEKHLKRTVVSAKLDFLRRELQRAQEIQK